MTVFDTPAEFLERSIPTPRTIVRATDLITVPTVWGPRVCHRCEVGTTERCCFICGEPIPIPTAE